MKNIAVAIFGPTAVGKTNLSIDITTSCGEIISVDSRQIYKYMDIGTAKPSIQELSKVKHHLIDIIMPDEKYAAGEFKRTSEKLIFEILNRNKIPFLVGGTGLYFSSLIRGMADIPEIKQDVKQYILDKWEEKGQLRMYSILQRVDNEYSQKIHGNDKQRTCRALEVFFSTGKNLSSYIKEGNTKSQIEYINIGLTLDRKELYDRIDSRVDQMLKNGFIEEVESLLKMGYDENCYAMKGIGYKEILLYLKSKISLDEAIYETKKNSRHYAKRQITWFKNMENTEWFDSHDKEKIKTYIFNKIGEKHS